MRLKNASLLIYLKTKINIEKINNNMKNLLKLLGVLMLFIGSFAFGQTKYEVITYEQTQKADGIYFKVPDELKFNPRTDDASLLQSVKVFDEESKGYVYFTGGVFEGKAKFLDIKVPKDSRYALTADTGCTGGSYTECAKGCTDKPTTVGVLLCTGYCVIQCW